MFPRLWECTRQVFGVPRRLLACFRESGHFLGFRECSEHVFGDPDILPGMFSGFRAASFWGSGLMSGVSEMFLVFRGCFWCSGGTSEEITEVPEVFSVFR
jgi:hypothetical protein